MNKDGYIWSTQESVEMKCSKFFMWGVIFRPWHKVLLETILFVGRIIIVKVIIQKNIVKKEEDEEIG